MKNRIKGWIQKGADKALSSGLVRGKLLEAANASELARYGRVTDLTLSLEARRIEVLVQLDGEAQPLRVSLERFAILGDEPGVSVRVDAVRVDRVWMQRFVDDHVLGRTFPVPAGHQKWLVRLRDLWS